MGEACCCSDQELLLRELAGGGDNPHRKEHPRLFAILDTFDGMTPVIDVQRGRLFTESMRRTEGQPLVLRWAKAVGVDLAGLEHLEAFGRRMAEDAGVRAALEAEGLE